MVCFWSVFEVCFMSGFGLDLVRFLSVVGRFWVGFRFVLGFLEGLLRGLL